jgi:hypothetical protein
VVLISAVFPIFVVSLAITAFANGLWMTVGGFFVSPTVLNVFWKYTFYQIDYQRYAFSALTRNQMVGSVYTCGANCECMLVTSLANVCKIEGSEAATQLGYITSNNLSYVYFPSHAKLTTGLIDCDYCWDEVACMVGIVLPSKVKRVHERFNWEISGFIRIVLFIY